MLLQHDCPCVWVSYLSSLPHLPPPHPQKKKKKKKKKNTASKCFWKYSKCRCQSGMNSEVQVKNGLSCNPVMIEEKSSTGGAHYKWTKLKWYLLHLALTCNEVVAKIMFSPYCYYDHQSQIEMNKNPFWAPSPFQKPHQIKMMYTARFSLHQVHGSQCTKEYYTKHSLRTMADVCMVSEVLRVVPCCQVPWMCPTGRQWQGTFDCPLPWGTLMALGCPCTCSRPL